MKNTIRNISVPISAFIIILGFWSLITYFFKIPRWVLPNPIAIFQTMFVHFDEFSFHIWVSFRSIIVGFLIAIPLGIIIAGLMSNFKILDKTFSPYIIFLVTTPIVTLVPLLMVWFGFGWEIRVIAISIQVMAIINLNASASFNNVPLLRLELMKSLRANRIQTFFRAVLPSALPEVFTGLKLGAIFAVITDISAEFVGGDSGLGNQIIKYSQYIKTEYAFSCIFFTGIIGIMLYLFVSLVEKLVIRWKI